MCRFYLGIVVFLNLQTYVKSQGPCGERILTGAVGGAVTLHVNDTETRAIIWIFNEGIIAVTPPGEPIEIYDERYEGRLSSSSNGTLTITNLTHEDQGIFRVQFFNNIHPYCSYHLSVFREITPTANYTMVNVIRLEISGFVLLIICFIFIHHMRTEVITQRPGTGST